MGFDLYGSKDGDLVRPVYRHTIIPAYVRDDFARWFAKNLHVMSGFSKEQLSEFLRGQNADAYDVKPLRNFLDNDDTHDIALEIIEELTAATNQLMAQRDAGNIRERFSSQIQQDLWDEYVSELGNKIVVSVSAQRPARLDWVWSFEEEDWVLRLRNLIAEAHQKPHTCVWSLATAEKALQDWDSVSQDIWPEQQTNGQWRVREISMSAADRPVINDGKFYVFDGYDNCIFEQSVPVLPNDEFQFYRITQQGMYAVPIPFKQLTPGEFLVSFRGTLQLLNAEHQVISPQQTDYYVSEIMQNNAGHQHIKRYEISLPVTIDAGTVKHRIERTKRRIAHPRLSEGHRVSNTSKRLPPVYTSNDIFIDFPEISVSTRALNVHVTGPIDDIYEPFDEHAEKEEEGYRLNLSQLIPAEQIGTYAVDVTYGFRSRLASPIEFSVLPNLRFNGLDEGVFHALNQPRIRISNVTTETVESPDESAKSKSCRQWRTTRDMDGHAVVILSSAYIAT